MNNHSNDTKNQKSGGKAFNLFLMVACAVMAVLVMLLAMQNRRLKEQVDTLLTPQLPPESLQEGSVLEPLALLDNEGNRVLIDFEGGDGQTRTLLMFFSPDCPACRQTLPVWSAVLQDRNPSIRIAGIRLGPEMNDVPYLSFTVYAPEDGGKSLAGKIAFVPATMILDAGGTIERLWYGALEEDTQAELAAILDEAT